MGYVNNRRTSKLWLLPKDELQTTIDNSSSIKEVIAKLTDLQPNSGGCYKTFNQRIKEDNLDLTKLVKRRSLLQEKRLSKRRVISKDQIFINNSNFNNSSRIKKLLKMEGMSNSCSICGLAPLWNRKVLTLQLDHVNGVHCDNRRENLRLLCPNCHSQTPTFGRRRRERPKNVPPRKDRPRVFDPTQQQLVATIINENFNLSSTGRLYGVSGNAIKKRLKTFKISIRSLKHAHKGLSNSQA